MRNLKELLDFRAKPVILIADQAQLPALKGRHGRARVQVAENGLTEAILEAFGYPPGQYDLASLRAQFDGLAADRHWLCADPINLLLDVGRAYSLGGAELQLSALEIEAYLAFLNEQLPTGFQLQAAQPTRWYLQLTDAWQIDCVAVDAMTGANVIDRLPKGQDYLKALQLFNELQMSLHTFALNQSRIEQGKPSVDALWFWGSGQPLVALKRCQWRTVYSEHWLGKVLARLNGVALMDDPCDAGLIIYEAQAD